MRRISASPDCRDHRTHDVKSRKTFDPGPAWIAVPTDLGDAPAAKQLAWGRRAALAILPKRFLREPKGSTQLKLMLGTVAGATGADEQWFVHRAGLPEEFLMVQLRWRPMSDEALVSLAGADAADEVVTSAATRHDVAGHTGYRADIVAGPDDARGWVSTVEFGDRIAQVRVSVPLALFDSVSADAEKLLLSIATA
jgi:hypothetical protein